MLERFASCSNERSQRLRGKTQESVKTNGNGRVKPRLKWKLNASEQVSSQTNKSQVKAVIAGETLAESQDAKAGEQNLAA